MLPECTSNGSFQSIDFPGKGEEVYEPIAKWQKLSFQSIDFPGKGEGKKKSRRIWTTEMSFQSIDFPGKGEVQIDVFNINWELVSNQLTSPVRGKNLTKKEIASGITVSNQLTSPVRGKSGFYNPLPS